MKCTRCKRHYTPDFFLEEESNESILSQYASTDEGLCPLCDILEEEILTQHAACMQTAQSLLGA